MNPQSFEGLTFEKVWAMFQETNKKFQETDKKFQETDKKFQETDKKIKELTSLFTTQWGKLMEALIKPSCLKLFKDRGIDINRTLSNVEITEKGEDIAEFDILLVNGTEVVVIEVKTTMKTEHIDYLIEKLQKIRIYFPEMADKVFYGAIAAIKYEEGTTRYAHRKGLFVLKNSGEGILTIGNHKSFKPARF